MEVAVISESSADESALWEFIARVAPVPVARCPLALQVRRGWPAMRDDVALAARAVVYRSSADAPIVVVDSDSSSVEEGNPQNRLEFLHRELRQALAKPPTGRNRLQFAIGVAIPCIEAWWLAPQQQHWDVSEDNWRRRSEHGTPKFTQADLKRRLYGTDKPSLADETRVMIEAASLAAGHVDLLEKQFAYGFAPLVRAIRAWR